MGVFIMETPVFVLKTKLNYQTMKSFKFLLLSAIPFLFQQSALPEVNRIGMDYALFFAVQDYDEWSDLRNPIKDADTIAKDLRDLYGFKTEIVKNPTKRMILSKLKTYRKKTYRNEDQLLVFLSGHGEFYDEIREGYFIPKDGEQDDEFHESYLSHDRLSKELMTLPCNHILVAIDACFSGTFSAAVSMEKGRPGLRPGANLKTKKQQFIRNTLRYKTRLFLTSGGKERTPDGVDHSPFTKQFLAALRGFGGEDQILTFNELNSQMELANPKPRWGQFADNAVGSSFLFVLKDEIPDIYNNIERSTYPKSNYKIEEEVEYTSFTNGTLLDRRDGNRYKTVNINGQVWMAENLKYKSNSSICYDNKNKNCKMYGRLYPFHDLIFLCPDGWKVPSEKDWLDLAMYLGGYYDVVKDNSIKNPQKGLKEFLRRFNPKFGGAKDLEYFAGINSMSAFWTSTSIDREYNAGFSVFLEDEEAEKIFFNSLLRVEAEKSGAYLSCLCVKK